MDKEEWAAGVDVGGTKIEVIQVSTSGKIGEKVKVLTDIKGGYTSVTREIVDAIGMLTDKIEIQPRAVGIGVAGQVEGKTGVVKFAPNLKWDHVPLSEDIQKLMGIPVVTTNDVRAATWGEWLHGSGKGYDHLLCVFVGTGVGGGIVCEGKMIDGFNNTAGEIGHITVSLDGPECTCGNIGCMEAFSGGWAITKRAKDAVAVSSEKGSFILELAGGKPENIHGKHVMEAALKGDPLASEVVNEAVEALSAGVSGLINAFSPQCVIFGGGVIEKNPWLLDRIEPRIYQRALKSATEGMVVTGAQLHNDAGAVGAASLAVQQFLRPTMNVY